MAGMMGRAGDFMASRVEHELPAWKKLYSRTWKVVGEQRERRNKRALEFRQRKEERQNQLTIEDSTTSSASSKLLTKTSTDPSALVSNPTRSADPAPSVQDTSFSSNDPDTQIFNALTHLFVSILEHVRLQTEFGDQIVDMLALGGVTGNKEVREAIGVYNDDLLWLILEREKEKEG